MRNSDVSWRDLYPFTSNWFGEPSHRQHYVDEGQGRPILMIHGNPTWSFYWRNLVLAFRDRYRIVAPDHLGCGLSDKPQDFPYQLTDHIQNLSRIIQHLDLRDITLLAHDWGGAIGLGAVLADRARFSRLVLFNTGAFPPPHVPFRIRCCRTPLLGTVAIRGLNLFARAALWMAVEDRTTIAPAAAAGLLAPYGNWRNRIAIDRFVRDIPFTDRHPTWQTLQEIEAGLSELATWPTKLIWGMRDWCFRPQCLERFEQIFPTAEVHHFPDVGHYVVEEAHQRIVPLVNDFLERTTQTHDCRVLPQ